MRTTRILLLLKDGIKQGQSRKGQIIADGPSMDKGELATR